MIYIFDSSAMIAFLRLADLLRFKLIERADFDRAFWQEAARLKADWRKISLADCFGVVLAQRLGGQFVTSDHHELDRLAAASFPLTFFR